MRLELDLSPDDWADYSKAPGADLKRVGVVVPVEPVGVRAFVRLGVKTDDGQLVTVMTPWLMWQAAHRALVERLGGDHVPAPEPAEPEVELPPVLADVAAAIEQHARQWDLDAGHPDGTSEEEWRDDANWSHLSATEAAMTGGPTWAHTLLEPVHAALVIEDPAELRQALARVAGTAAAWMTAIDGRTADG